MLETRDCNSLNLSPAGLDLKTEGWTKFGSIPTDGLY